MKKNVLLFIALSVLTIAGFFIACNKQNQTVEAIDDRFAEIKEYFTKVMILKNNVSSNNSDVRSDSRKLLWNKGITYRSGNSTVFQIPFMANRQHGYEIYGKDQRARIPLALKENVGYKYVVINKDDNGFIDYAIMTVIGDEEYLKINGNNLEGNNFKNLKADFSGYVIFHNWSNKFLNGWVYKNGKIISKLGIQNTSNPNGKVTCAILRLDEWCEDCTDWYVNGEYDYTQCGSPYICSGLDMLRCVDDGTGNGPVGSGGSGGYEYDVTAVSGEAILCQANILNMQSYGDGWTANLRGVVVTFEKRYSTVPRLRLVFGDICITIPKLNKSSFYASEKFRNAFNTAVQEVTYELNGVPFPSTVTVAYMLQQKVEEILSLYNPKAIVSWGNCLGNVPITVAKYGPACY